MLFQLPGSTRKIRTSAERQNGKGAEKRSRTNRSAFVGVGRGMAKAVAPSYEW